MFELARRCSGLQNAVVTELAAYLLTMVMQSSWRNRWRQWHSNATATAKLCQMPDGDHSFEDGNRTPWFRDLSDRTAHKPCDLHVNVTCLPFAGSCYFYIDVVCQSLVTPEWTSQRTCAMETTQNFRVPQTYWSSVAYWEF